MSTLFRPEIWNKLPNVSREDAELVAEPLPNFPSVFAAVDSRGLRHLLLEAADDDDLVSDSKSRGISAETKELRIQGSLSSTFIDVSCSSDFDHEVFDLVLESLIRQLEAGTSISQAVVVTLATWRNFFGSSSNVGLTEQEMLGLLGELWFMSRWLEAIGPRRVTYWFGPSSSHHDFQWLGAAVEVKSTKAASGLRHRIHGLAQLETPPNSDLFLLSLRFRPEVNGAYSLPSMVDEIRGKLQFNSESLEEFEDKLSEVGYSELDAFRYQGTRFSLKEERLYEVAEGFPRLTHESFPNGLPSGIENITYEIDLSGQEAFVRAESPSDVDTSLAGWEPVLGGS